MFKIMESLSLLNVFHVWGMITSLHPIAFEWDVSKPTAEP